MPAMHSISYTRAKRNLGAAMDKAVESRAPVLITRRGGDGVVLVSAEEWTGMEETLNRSMPAEV